MSILTKQDIIDTIRKTAKENGSKPLGYKRFEKETGIKPHEWGKYWARFSDAQKEAGLTPNQLQVAHTDEFISEKVISLIRKKNKFPTLRELLVERTTDIEFPSMGAFRRLGTKEQIATKIIDYCKGKEGYDDVAKLCDTVLEFSKSKDSGDHSVNQIIGEVYLLKSGRYYKIGKTNDTVRRGTEIRIQLPEKCTLIHSIKTDDPSGIEAYWHKRFEAKRMNGEWFDLSPAQVKAFKLWRRIS